ncbi:class I adenylate-forming enzyme family protein [Allokutzneria sp. NRRL B-24872]|uniref:class I adenylate-forming enzyme family protein n=1 Tax=Allokutzneria sp. NRRL B-24872 TaxID=1137961 RepID=UPI00143E0A82|nr:AMP-binding protein [Allokutzneria sp. NRRL B-24872]
MAEPANGRWVEATTLGHLLDRRAEEHPDRVALSFPGEQATYGVLAERANLLARGLIGLGVGRGEPVGIMLSNRVDSLAALFAAAKIGAIPVPVNARFKGYELNQVVTHSGLRVLLTEPAFTELLTETLGDGPRLVLPDDPEFLELAGRTPTEELRRRQALVRVRDTAVVMYTSGTTASPKGAMLSHEAFCRFAAATVHERFELTPEDRIWTALPLFHIGGIAFAIASIYGGCSYVHTGFYDPVVALDQLESQRCTIALPGFETIWLPVVNQPDFASRDLSALRVVMAVGVPERLRDMASRLPSATQVSCFGMTEACSFLALNHRSDSLEERVTTGGHPLPGMECRVVDPQTGVDLPPGTEGELVFRGSNCFDGYYKDPELSQRVFDAEGWFHTGDIATMDADGRVTFVSRLKDMLKVGGENVSAAEVEGYLLRHDAVLMAQVVGAPDDHYVEVPAAFVQLKPGAEVTEQELIDFCLGAIATYRVPRYVRFVTEWPMSGTKIKKYVLRERVAEELRDRGITRAPKLVSSR